MKFQLILTCLLAMTLSHSYGQDHHKKKFTHSAGTYLDERDGKEYKTITFTKLHHSEEITRTWFAENAQYAVEDSKCYNDIKEYCEEFGRLYNYEQANKACPEGWHVPTIHEWKHLFSFFGGRHHSGQFLVEGKESDMHMLYGGFGEPGNLFRHITRSGNWWDNELKDSRSAGIITLKEGSGEIFHSVVGDTHLLSTRCVKYHN